MIAPFQVGRVKIISKRDTVEMSIIHEKLGQPATLTHREALMLAEELANIVEKAEKKPPLRRRIRDED